VHNIAASSPKTHMSVLSTVTAKHVDQPCWTGFAAMSSFSMLRALPLEDMPPLLCSLLLGPTECKESVC